MRRPAVVRYALQQSKPDAVFHAAAYKHVPVLETQLREAIRNNVLATETVVQESLRSGVGTFVLISTDKAVDPANVLGASKRLAEMVCQAMADPLTTRFITVRFGNVLDSAGSVVPLFREQIRNGGPVTVTDADVTRYFMTIQEACQLILQASAIGSQQAIYTLDMGEPVPIRLLAEQMIRLAGKQPERDIAIIYTGLRAGEKLHETLFHADERYRPTSHPKILQAEAREVSAERINGIRMRLRDAVGRYDIDALAMLLREAVPEFVPAGSPEAATESRDRRGIPRKSIPQDMSKRIRKAVFPVAGLGTRFLPATKTVPKEMLPIVDRPLIQYAVDEAIEAGCDTLDLRDQPLQACRGRLLRQGLRAGAEAGEIRQA